MSKIVFVTGAAGYIGGSVAAKLVKAGYQVKGLTRSEAKVEGLKSLGIEPIVGSLADAELVTQCALQADVVVDAADSDNLQAVKTIIAALSGSDKIFIHTSGSTTVADRANGEPSPAIFTEATEFQADEHKLARVAIDNLVIESAKQGIRSAVICPCMIYGKGLGFKTESIQIPKMIKQAIAGGVAKCIGRGQNIWSTVHIEDLADLYLTVIEKAPAGGLFLFAENGEVSFRQLADKIKEALELKSDVEEWPIEQAIAEWSFEGAVLAFGSNSRIRGVKSRELGWTPKHNSVLDDVRRACANLTSLARS